MHNIKLLSNGKYHVIIMRDGSVRSRWNGLAITRWSEDAVLANEGSRTFLRDDGPPTTLPKPQPTNAGSWREAAAGANLVAAQLKTSSYLGYDIERAMTVAVAMNDDVEIRRVRVTNLSSRERPLSATSFAEIVLSPPATDAAHPAFSKLFVETEIDANLGTILATRRPSVPEDTQSWLFHAAVAAGASGALSFQTDRMRFIGRGRTVADAQELQRGKPLSGHAGPVLDAIAAIHVPFSLKPGGSCTVDWFTGIAGSRSACEALARKYRTVGAGDRLLSAANTYRDATLRRIGATEPDSLLYERLAGSIIYVDAALRADTTEIAQNRRGQSSLRSLGLSGDVPVVLLRVANEEDLNLVTHLVRAHAFWIAYGIKTELLIVSTPLHAGLALLEKVKRTIADNGGTDLLGRPDGIFLRDGATLDDGDLRLLDSVARVVIADGGGGLADVFDQSKRDHPTGSIEGRAPAWTKSPPASGPGSQLDVVAAAGASAVPTELFAYNGYGGFAPDLREYVITAATGHMTPTPWTNVISNPEFGTLVSESGSASTWSENAHEFRLTPWSNDPVSDPNTEAFYIRDEETGRFWSPTLLPTRSSAPYLVRHGFGYSTFEHTEEGVESELRIYVAIDAPVKFCVLTLRNRSNRARCLSVTGYVEWVLGDERVKTLMHVVTEVDEDSGGVFARNGYNTDFAERTAFFDVDEVAGFDRADRSACGDRADFFGPSGTRAAPAAMSHTRLSGRLGAALDPCAALRVTLGLGPSEERAVVFRLGAGKSTAEARALVRRWRGAEAADEALHAVHAYWRRALGAIQVRTPDATVDALANGWLLYQVIASRLWGRTGFYQSSGAFGFRDQLQDVMALVHGEPALVREHLLSAASRQFPEGDVQHWWHPPSGTGVRTRCSDDYLWLAFVTSRYVEVTGDMGVLDVSCPFIESRVLKDGEQSHLSSPQVSAQTASLYEHCVRAIRHGLRYGERGLPLIGMGDWNDGMNLVGAGGKGESVWLALFLIAVLKRFAPLAHARSDLEFADLCESEASVLSKRIEAKHWDGAWYRRAYFDDGSPLGSAANAECRIDSIAQSWSVLSGAAPANRARMAMDSVDRLLVNRNTRLVQLLDPPFDTSKPSPGYIAGYVPGVRENGGQYTHAAVWATLAFAALGDADRAWELFGMLNPLQHTSNAAEVAVYQVEPYVVAGDVYAFPPHAGRGGWAWYTGSAGWMYQLLIESLLGLQRSGNLLRVRPLLPRDWQGFDIQYRLGKSTYEIACRGATTFGAATVTVDGVIARDGWLTLIDDGKTHTVIVDVQRSSQPLAA